MTDYFEEVPAVSGGKRCGIRWTPWMGDWFTSWSPRNSNSNAEGPWDHWVDLAIQILQDPMTERVRPEAHALVKDVKVHNFYDQSSRELTNDELAARFVKTTT